MKIYAVIFEEENQAALETIKATWPGIKHFIMNPHVAFIAPSDPILTRTLAEMIGLKEKSAGIVIDTAAWNGYASSDFVEWVEKAGGI